GELVPPKASNGDAILSVAMQVNPTTGNQTAVIEDPDHNRHGIDYPVIVLDYEKQRLDSFVEIVKYCDSAGLKQALTFAKNNLREQRDLAEQLMDAIQPLVQSTYWQLDVMVANRGDRIVLLSPYAVLTTKGGHRQFPPLPLTVSPTQEGAKESQDNGGPESHS